MKFLCEGMFGGDTLLQSVMTVGCVVGSMYPLADAGMNSSLLDLIVPGSLIFFGPQLCANMVCRQSEISRHSLAAYLIGMFIFSVFCKFQSMKIAVMVFPLFERGSLLVSLKNEKEKPLHLVVAWLITREISEIIILETLIKGERRLTMTAPKLAEMFLLIVILFVGRLYDISDSIIIAITVVVSLGKHIYRFIHSYVSPAEEENEVEKKPAKKPKTPKRKAAQVAEASFRQRK